MTTNQVIEKKQQKAIWLATEALGYTQNAKIELSKLLKDEIINELFGEYIEALIDKLDEVIDGGDYQDETGLKDIIAFLKQP